MLKPPYSQTAWSLAELFPHQDSAEMQSAFAELDRQAGEIEAARSLLTPDISQPDFLALIKKLEDAEKLGRRVYSFASLSFAANTQDENIQTFMARIQQLVAELTNRTLFFQLWWKELDDANAQHLLSGSGDYRYWLETIRQFKPHTLTEAEEKVINIKDTTGARAIVSLYNTITNRYTFKVLVGGEEKEMTRGELMTLVRQADPALRAAAYQEMYRVYAKDGNVLGQMYQTLVRDWRNENINLRHYTSPIAMRNLENDIPDDVVQTLLAVCQQNAPVFQRYFRLKARLLGVEKLRRYDIYAPVGQDASKQYAYADAASMVLDSFRKFHPQVAALAERVFAENHLDSEVRKGKQSGAFCASTTPGVTPWVKLNYQGQADDVATMAHELGHAIHAMLAAEHTTFTFHSSLPLAETASTFGEMLLVDSLLNAEPDEAVRRDLLFSQVDGAYGTILRQAFFALFECQAHEMTRQGASVKDLCDAYLVALKEQFGDAVEVSDEFRWEWISIPHIYQVPFYVYAYSFGQLLVLSLYRQYQQEGEAFKPRYLKILAAGGSASPESILKDAGIDIHSAAFWQGGFDVLTDLVARLEKS